MIIGPELIPKPLHRRNARRFPGWKAISADVLRLAEGRCAVCRAVGSALNCHERWSYDESNGLATLIALAAVCSACHEVFHMGRAREQGRLDAAQAHMAGVTGSPLAEVRRAFARAMRIHQRRSQISDWTMTVAPDLLSKYPALAALTERQPTTGPLFD